MADHPATRLRKTRGISPRPHRVVRIWLRSRAVGRRGHSARSPRRAWGRESPSPATRYTARVPVASPCTRAALPWRGSSHPGFGGGLPRQAAGKRCSRTMAGRQTSAVRGRKSLRKGGMSHGADVRECHRPDPHHQRRPGGTVLGVDLTGRWEGAAPAHRGWWPPGTEPMDGCDPVVCQGPAGPPVGPPESPGSAGEPRPSARASGQPGTGTVRHLG
jgi:hypothetical protein